MAPRRGARGDRPPEGRQRALPRDAAGGDRLRPPADRPRAAHRQQRHDPRTRSRRGPLVDRNATRHRARAGRASAARRGAPLRRRTFELARAPNGRRRRVGGVRPACRLRTGSRGAVRRSRCHDRPATPLGLGSSRRELRRPPLGRARVALRAARLDVDRQRHRSPVRRRPGRARGDVGVRRSRPRVMGHRLAPRLSARPGAGSRRRGAAPDAPAAADPHRLAPRARCGTPSPKWTARLCSTPTACSDSWACAWCRARPRSRTSTRSVVPATPPGAATASTTRPPPSSR